jgi:hypothetical protein
MNASFKPFNLSTKNALDVTTAWLEANPAAVILLTAKPAFHASLLQRLSITPNLSLLTAMETSEKPFSLLMAQPAEKDLALLEHLLNNPHLCQVIHLQPTWIGRRLLPEWKPTRQNTVIKTINRRLGDWIFEDRSIGNLQSLLWGFPQRQDVGAKPPGPYGPLRSPHAATPIPCPSIHRPSLPPCVALGQGASQPVTGQPTEHIANTVLSIDAWLETMRQPGGYGGPVTHRWQDSLIYTGPGMDWRYEGIISGYLTLFEKTSQRQWLNKAVRAGLDVVDSQHADGTYPASSFEINPTSGGTPHEAACDLALLRLAARLKTENSTSWPAFVETAKTNLERYHLDVLWDAETGYFYNQPHDPSFVPNKAATICEALIALADLDHNAFFAERYIQPTLDKILTCQVTDPGQPLDGAIDQSTLGDVPSGRYFPLYIARCIPALVKAYQAWHHQPYLQAAKAAMGFIIRTQNPDGSLPQVLYPNQRRTEYPQWIAGVGDILRAAALLAPYGLVWTTMTATETWLLAGRLPSGGYRTAHGFALLESHRKTLPDFRDVLPVCGWVDKAFAYLASRLPDGVKLDRAEVQDAAVNCTYWGQPALFHETGQMMAVIKAQKPVYRWEKKQVWAEKF